MAFPSHSHDADRQFPGLNAVRKAATRLCGQVVRTPLMASESLSSPACQVRLKLEILQTTGSFKLRGATNALLALSERARERGVVCASTGNHGRAVVHAATQVGTRAVVCLSHLVPENKVEAIRALGGEVRIVGRSQDDAQIEVSRLVRDDGLTEIPPFDHADVIAGQGTVGLELHEEWAELDAVVVPLSGGGLIAGIATALKALKPSVRIIGVSMERGAAMIASLNAGAPVDVGEEETLADSLGGGIGLDNRYTFAMVRDLVDEVITVNEDAIAQAMRHMALNEGLVVEGAGAVPVAAVLDGALVDRNVALVVSGRNVAAETLCRVLSHAQKREVRL